MLTQKDRKNAELIKKILTKRKLLYHALGTKSVKKVTVESEKANNLITNILTGNITKLSK